MRHDDDDWIFGLLILIVFIASIAHIVGFDSGMGAEREDLLTAYCQSVEYADYIEIGDSYYCHDGDRLRAIEWIAK